MVVKIQREAVNETPNKRIVFQRIVYTTAKHSKKSPLKSLPLRTTTAHPRLTFVWKENLSHFPPQAILSPTTCMDCISQVIEGSKCMRGSDSGI